MACRVTSIRTLGDDLPNSFNGIKSWVDDVAIGLSLDDE